MLDGDLAAPGVDIFSTLPTYTTAAMEYRATTIASNIVLATVYFFILLWCNTAGQRMPK